MTTLPNVRAMLRRVLEDTDAAAYLWPDAELADHLRVALDGYSRLVPRQVQQAIAPTGASLYTPASDPLRVLAVEWPAGTIVPRRIAPASGTADATSWHPFGGAVAFSRAIPAGTGSIVVWYEARHVFPASDAADFGIQPDGDDYLVYGAAVLAIERRELSSGKRRFRVRGEDLVLRAARASFRMLERRIKGARSGALTLAE